MIVVEPRSLPLPDVPDDPRRTALGAVVEELEALGMPSERCTILIAGGLERRAGRRAQEAVITPTEARSFRGSVQVHDAESPSSGRSNSTTGRPRGCTRHCSRQT